MSALSALANYTDDEEEEENEEIQSTNIATSEQKGFNAFKPLQIVIASKD